MSSGQQTVAQPEPSDQVRQRVNQWYQQHGSAVVQEVRRWLRKGTRPVASESQVAQSVWASLLEGHLHELQIDDPNCAWGILVRAVRRHCEKHNKTATRHPNIPTESLPGLEITSGSESCPETLVLARECSQLFELPPESGQALALSEEGLVLVERLSPRQRAVLGLKLAGCGREEIARKLDIEVAQVDMHWRKVKEVAERVAGVNEG